MFSICCTGFILTVGQQCVLWGRLRGRDEPDIDVKANFRCIILISFHLVFATECITCKWHEYQTPQVNKDMFSECCYKVQSWFTRLLAAAVMAKCNSSSVGEHSIFLWLLVDVRGLVNSLNDVSQFIIIIIYLVKIRSYWQERRNLIVAGLHCTWLHTLAISILSRYFWR